MSELNMNPLSLFLNAAIEAATAIITRHHQETGEILTDEGVKQRLAAEVIGGKTIIDNWFKEKAKTPPV